MSRLLFVICIAIILLQHQVINFLIRTSLTKASHHVIVHVVELQEQVKEGQQESQEPEHLKPAAAPIVPAISC